MYLYHFCAIWKLLDIKGRSIILGEPPFLGGDSSLPLSFHATGSHGSQGPLCRAGSTSKTRTQLLFSLPPEQHPAQNGLTVPENALRKPQTNHYHMDTATPLTSKILQQWRELVENILRLRESEFGIIKPLTAHNMGPISVAPKLA